MNTTFNQNLISSDKLRLRSRVVQDFYCDYLQSLDQNAFTFFHLSTTYLPYQDISYSPKILNKFFINFYLKNLLPDLFQSRKWTKTTKMVQPIVLSFLDEHKIDPVPIGISASGQPIHASPLRLHHHSIIASRTSTTDSFLAMTGDNTFLRYSSKMMTSNLKQCDANRVYYASKMLWKYPEDYLIFGFRQ